MKTSSEKSLSMVQLVLSQYCKDIFLVDYFRKYVDNHQVLKALFIKLSHLPERSLVEILPNIIYIYCNTKNKEVEKFLYGLCKRSQTVYLTIRWAFRAYNENSNHSEEEFEMILNKMDQEVMNRNKFDEEKVDEKERQAKLIEFIQTKYHESLQIHLTNEFYSHLTRITTKLKDYVIDQRENQLRLLLQKFYERFLRDIAQKASRCLPGMYFPIPSESNFIVNIDYQYCIPFSTKERVPYKIVFQTVSYDELMKSQRQKQELTKSVFKAMSTKRVQECDIEQAKENQDNEKINKQTASNFNQYMKKYGDLSDQKIETSSYLKSDRKYFDEEWKAKTDKIIQNSVYKGLKSHRVRAYMVKGGDDLRQQFFAMQLIKQVYKIVKQSGLKIWLKTYDVVIYTRNSGFIQFIPDTTTISTLKKVAGTSLKHIYKHLFGDRLDHAIKNFVVSLAGYSIVQYLFQIKDRHNGNIMIDSEGHIIHIDFGFLLGSSPGNMNFQKAPFKLTADYIELMEGTQSQYYKFFKELLFMGFSFLKGYVKEIINLIQIMKQNSDLPCFWYYRQKDIRYRMMENCTDDEIRKRIDGLLYESAYSYSTRHYDRFQWYTNGIYR